MTKTLLTWCAGGVVLALTTGCDLAVLPPIACPTDTPPSFNLQYKSPRAGVACAFPDVLNFNVTRTPKIDATAATTSGAPTPNASDLVNALVSINSGGTALGLCTGANCDPTLSTLQTRIDAYGSFSYTVQLNLEALGALPDPGGSATVGGVAAYEVYGPGNSCAQQFLLTAACAEASAQ
jgi:hypothetical protein